MTAKQLLDWFDCVERVEVRNRVAQYRWSTETMARDQLFLELFFDESDMVWISLFQNRCREIDGQYKLVLDS